jgi:hypothetical protein
MLVVVFVIVVVVVVVLVVELVVVIAVVVSVVLIVDEDVCHFFIIDSVLDVDLIVVFLLFVVRNVVVVGICTFTIICAVCTLPAPLDENRTYSSISHLKHYSYKSFIFTKISNPDTLVKTTKQLYIQPTAQTIKVQILLTSKFLYPQSQQ